MQKPGRSSGVLKNVKEFINLVSKRQQEECCAFPGCAIILRLRCRCTVHSQRETTAYIFRSMFGQREMLK